MVSLGAETPSKHPERRKKRGGQRGLGQMRRGFILNWIRKCEGEETAKVKQNEAKTLVWRQRMTQGRLWLDLTQTDFNLMPSS